MRSPLAWLYVVVFGGLLIVGGLAFLFGIVANIGRWVHVQTGGLGPTGALVLNLLWGAVLLACAWVIARGVWSKLPPRFADTERKSPGWAAMAVALFVGFVAWFGMIG